jgi:single-stranded-DNA-specific exonuclease
LVSRTNSEFLDYLSSKASISPVLAQVLVNRGIKDVASIRDFLYPSLDNLHDPFLMPDMERAVERLKIAIDRNETIFIHGDYDADGITSTALLMIILKEFGLKTFYHIPNRTTEGYGLSPLGIQKARACETTLIVTADCGISSVEEVLSARSMGMDVIITDHHEPSESLPDAIAVINPHRVDSTYPFKYLAGVGVVFKLIQALNRDSRFKIQNSKLEELLDLVALGTIADSVPLVGENRIFAVFGLKEINKATCRTGIKALKGVSGVNNKELHSGLLSYTLIPRVNAAGRLDDAGQVVELFLTDNESKAQNIAALLEEQNRKRQKIENEVLKSALEMIDPDRLDSAIVLSSPEWHPGVIGIVASRLVDMFYRPIFLFSIKESIAKGSARSIPPLNLYKAIADCSDILIGFGGHRQAAGLKLATENLSIFKEKIINIVERKLSDSDMIPVLEIDAAVKFSDINFNLIKELSLLEPYGDSNKEPVFGAKGARIVDLKIVGNNHLKMQLRQESINIDTIGFNMGNQLEKIEIDSPLDVAFVPCINEWNGTRTLQLNLKAIRPSN